MPQIDHLVGLRVAGRCATHNDLAWRWGDGSIGCMWCLIVESSRTDCVWEPMPSEWLTESGDVTPDAE